MTVVRNLEIKLDVDEDAHSVLDATFEQFRQAAQHVADYGWSDDPTQIIESESKLHNTTYSDVREKTNLTANHVQAARSLAANALENCKDRILEDGKKASKPKFRGTVVVYDGRTITYNDDHCTLSTTEDR
ncbi:MAG: RNA-guided endonuclease TnpB family protein, partial [Halodesulfurarchaeum sp.]